MEFWDKFSFSFEIIMENQFVFYFIWGERCQYICFSHLDGDNWFIGCVDVHRKCDNIPINFYFNSKRSLVSLGSNCDGNSVSKENTWSLSLYLTCFSSVPAIQMSS